MSLCNPAYQLLHVDDATVDFVTSKNECSEYAFELAILSNVNHVTKYDL